MEKKEIFRKVGMIMTELNEQYQYLSEKPENLNDLELELFLANSHFLTDHIEILRKLNGYLKTSISVPQTEPADTTNTAVKTTSVVNSDAVKEIESEKKLESPEYQGEGGQEIPGVEEVSPEVAEIKEEVKPEVTDNKDIAEITSPQEEQTKKEQTPEVSLTTAQEVVKEIIIPEKTISVEAAAVTPEEPASIPTINEMISAQVNSSTVATQFTNKPVADLKAIINLNDKLLFIKDLFNGYSLAYSEAIELLNRFDNFESADNFLKVNYATKNNWNDKQQTVDKLYEILQRRFTK